MMKPLVLAAFLLLALLQSPMSKEAGEVVVSIAPLHSLVKSVMGETGEPVLLLSGYASPHSFQLKPSQLRKMQSAKAVFYVSRGFETFLERSLNGLPDTVRKISLMESPDLKILSYREGGAWSEHDHEEEAHHHENEEAHENHKSADDPHIWLDPLNAILMVDQIERELGEIFPKNKEIYVLNAQTMKRKIKGMTEIITQKLLPVSHVPFVVFHDSYQYFERHFEVSSVGSILLEPSALPSIARLQEIREQIADAGAKCIFREPQFSDKLVKTASEGSDIKSGLLDPLGATLHQGSDLYIRLMEGLADEMYNCLK